MPGVQHAPSCLKHPEIRHEPEVALVCGTEAGRPTESHRGVFFVQVSWWLPARTSSALQEVALDGAPGSPECELILGGVGLSTVDSHVRSTYCVPGTVGATRDIQVKAGGGKTRRLTGWRPGKSVHGVTHRTPGKQSGRLRGGYSRKASQKRRPASWALQGECRAAGWGASGPGGERQRCPRQNEESEHGLEAGGFGALRGAAGRSGALREHHTAPCGSHGSSLF